MMEMFKRAGWGQDDSGVAGTGQGELALPCRACPDPEMNLPEGWDEMDEDQRYVVHGDGGWERNWQTEQI
jgi:hypothetical protein